MYELVGEVIGQLSCDVQAGRRTCQASSLVQLESGFGWLNLSAAADVIVEVPGVKPKSWIGCYMQILVAIHICPVLSPLSLSHFLISESNNLSCSPHGSYVHLSLSLSLLFFLQHFHTEWSCFFFPQLKWSVEYSEFFKGHQLLCLIHTKDNNLSSITKNKFHTKTMDSCRHKKLHFCL